MGCCGGCGCSGGWSLSRRSGVAERCCFSARRAAVRVMVAALPGIEAVDEVFPPPA